jgi:two-component system phosphate regulon response regulator OmpR
MAEKLYHILVVDDDTRLRGLLTKYLNDNGFNVSMAKDTSEARELMGKTQFDLLVLDVMLPEENGMDFAAKIRENSKIPILMLTAMGDQNHRIKGLETGADDYLSKPFEPKELVLRINNILRRINTNQSQDDFCNFGDFVFNFNDLRLKKDGEYIYLTDSEARILLILCKELGKAITREKLSELCGGIDDRSIDVQITRLRRKIEQNPKQPQFLQTVRNQGYILYK